MCCSVRRNNTSTLVVLSTHNIQYLPVWLTSKLLTKSFVTLSYWVLRPYSQMIYLPEALSCISLSFSSVITYFLSFWIDTSKSQYPFIKLHTCFCVLKGGLFRRYLYGFFGFCFFFVRLFVKCLIIESKIGCLAMCNDPFKLHFIRTTKYVHTSNLYLTSQKAGETRKQETNIY